jgi:hypothetical protein
MALVDSAEMNIEHVHIQKELNVVNEHRDDNVGLWVACSTEHMVDNAGP